MPHVTIPPYCRSILPRKAAATWEAPLGGDALHAHAAALRRLHALAWREAEVQAFADAFLLVAACLVLATAMVPLMRRVAPPKAPPADAH